MLNVLFLNKQIRKGFKWAKITGKVLPSARIYRTHSFLHSWCQMLATHAHRNWWPKIHTFLWAKDSLFWTQVFLVLPTAFFFLLLFLDMIQENVLKVIKVWYLGPNLEILHNGLLQDGVSLMLSKDFCQTQESLIFCWHLQSADKLT